MTASAAGALPASSGAPMPADVRRRYLVANVVVATTAGIVALVFLLLAYLTWDAHSRALEQGEARARVAATMHASRTLWVLGSSLSLMDLVARDAALLPAAAAGQALPSALRLSGHGVGLDLYDAAGRRIAGRAATESSDISDTEFYADLRDGREWAVSSREPSLGPGVVLARAFARAGQFAGAVVLRIDKSVFDVVWESLGLPPGSTLSLVRDDGAVIVRHPSPEAPVSLAGTPVFETLLGSESGSYISESSPVDGVARVVSFEHVPGFGLIAIGSVPRRAILEPLWQSLALVLIMLTPIAAAAMGGALVTARLLRRGARTQQRLEATLAHNDLLFHEIHHRVKNNLQSVSALFQMQPIPREVKVDMSQRIAAMAAIHEQIYRSSNFQSVEVQPYFRTLLMGLKASYQSNAEVIDELEDVEVDREVATPLGLIFNEVVSNAYKHAFPDGRSGRISIRLLRESADQGVLEIEDNGVGIVAGEGGKTRGIGQRLITSLTEQIGGTSNYEANGGTRFRLTFPLKGSAPARGSAPGA